MHQKIATLRDIETFWSLDDAFKMFALMDFKQDLEEQHKKESKKK